MEKVIRRSFSSNSSDPINVRRNEVFIQMISESFRKKLFGDKLNCHIDGKTLDKIKSSLASHGLWKRPKKKKNNKQDEDGPMYPSEPLPPIEFKLPKIVGKNIEEHFHNIGEKYSKPYKLLADEIATNPLPKTPDEWSFTPGWTKYKKDKFGRMTVSQVDFPDDRALIFDVEVCMNDGSGKQPTMATCASPDAWYSWCSPRLININYELDVLSTKFQSDQQRLNINDMIPMGSFPNNERLIVGHNVSFDRSFIKDQNLIDCDKTRFLDTMSLHISLSGLTGYQRALSFSYKVGKKNGMHDLALKTKFENAGHPDPGGWQELGSLNSLKDVYAFHCKKEMSKEERDLFVKGSLADIRDNAQQLFTYCANDVHATHEVFQQIWKQYLNRFPHPVTLAGMLEMSVMYLPVNIQNWERYLEEAQTAYDDLEREVHLCLQSLANQSCSLLKNKAYMKDVWLWDLDWSTQELRFKKEKVKKPSKKSSKVNKCEESSEEDDVVKQVLSTENKISKVQPLLPGYPAWYRDLCDQPFGGSKLRSDEKLINWQPGPSLISTSMRAAPKLLRMLWRGYPLHYDETHKWGYLVPDSNSSTPHGSFPFSEYLKIISSTKISKSNTDSLKTEDPDWMDQELFEENISLEEDDNDRSAIKMFGCKFFRLPHKSGPDNKVGNPLGKEFLRYLDDGTLSTFLKKTQAQSFLQISKTLSYWKNSNKRIYSQLVVPIDSSGSTGALLPRVIVAGTITRRAVEPTWLTASNAVKDRLGSELKAMIQVPKGYKLVGADVDSQELWIASLIGDSHFARIHGSTPIGWMTLQGSKAQKTDMHSKVAEMVGINRDQAKVLNYGRIYGAGKAFAARFLKQSNEDLAVDEARNKAVKIYKQTKGTRVNVTDLEKKFVRKEWQGGSESQMFNKLEQIALSPEPCTPVLDCKISTALLPIEVRQQFVPSVVNWVVQSSAVDYLHLMLVNMKWLLEVYNIDGRFSLSIHDEVRYMVKESDAYKAALALQVTNLFTRSMFASKLGMYDLPQSVAFFSSIDIDTVLRKEVYLDCKTPSNPHGLKLGYGIDQGESLNIYQLLEKPEIQHLISHSPDKPTGGDDSENVDPSIIFTLIPNTSEKITQLTQT
ncbi:DNA polymerase subunit gamma-1 [Tetranychus urticae]|uniref:DNA-directed DNA polymerase n=1 Tax=Tetranychus urticae TaxID=32264 RepID=T1KY09_TETUR|nr:DNA polymerase subunit gamma-1 [Tetranychus urticae]